jgi:dnd system-associated protein 4
MNEAEPTRDTVVIDEAVHDLYKRLTEGTDAVSAPFRTMKDVFMFAASIGYQRGERRPLAGRRLIVFRWAQFSAQTDIPVLKAIAIADTGDVDVLRNQDLVLSIVEDYANAGIHELRRRLLDQHGLALWNLVDAI